MTDDDLEFLTELKNKFWHEFSALCNRYIEVVRVYDPELVDHAEMMLGESTSIYGRETR